MNEPTQATTVGDLLADAFEAELEKRGELEGEAGAWVALVGETLDQALPDGLEAGDPWRVFGMLREALDVPIPNLLIAAWQRYEPFRKYVDPKAYPRGTESEVPLADHTARAALEPEVDLMLGGAVLATLRFQTEVTLTLEGAVVMIRDGRFVSARTGDCSVQVEVLFRDQKLFEVGPAKERVPGTISFDSGVAIDPFGEDPYALPVA